MSKGKKGLITGIILSVLSILIGIAGVAGYFQLKKHIEHHTAQWQKIRYIAFAKSADNNPNFIPVEDFKKALATYEFKWDDYNTYTHYNSIETKEEKLIYKIYEYAMENGTPFIYIESSLVPAYKDLYDMLELLSVDSAVVDQNSSITYYNEKFQVYQQYLHKIMVKNGKCIKVNIADFTDTKNEKIEESVKKAEDILKGLDFTENSTDKEKAEAIYHYLGKKVKYKEYEEHKYQFYLYDTLIEGSSNCDGYANAFSLLCNMADIPCFEKMNTGLDDGEIGHTWNTMCLDGIWYNADATASPNYYEGSLKGILFCFGYSDNQQSDKHRYTGFIPECTEDMITADCVFKSTSDKSIAEKASTALENTDKDYILIVFDDFDKSKTDNIMQDIADSTYNGIKYITLEGNYHTLVFIFPK
ncbi:MAG: hypothetical protein IJD93_02820 [Ruminococcus sp.]|nr:hypothetical protein [Ruminococcus sp.]